MTADYAATDEKRDEAREAELAGDLRQSRGIEVGHIFYFGDKYTKPLGFTVSGHDGQPVTPVGRQLWHRRFAPRGRDHRGEP